MPWGSSKVFTPVAPPRLPPSQDAPPPSSQAAAEAAAALEADQQLPPGVEPLILWDPAAAAAGAASAAVMGGDAAPAGPAGGEGTAIEVDRMLTRWLRPHQREGVAVGGALRPWEWDGPREFEPRGAQHAAPCGRVAGRSFGCVVGDAAVSCSTTDTAQTHTT